MKALPLLVLTLLPMTAMADRGEEFARHIFAEADTDGDGELTFAELKAHLDAHLNGANRPKDAPPRPTDEQLTEWFTSMDTDESGTLTLAEFIAGHRSPPPRRD